MTRELADDELDAAAEERAYGSNQRTTLDPKTENQIRALRLYGQHPVITAAAGHIRQLATERDTARRCREINQEQREEWRAKCDAAQRELADLRRSYDTLRENHTELQKEAVETKAELERLREAVRWLNSSSWWRPWHESLGKDPAAALIRLHERNKPR